MKTVVITGSTRGIGFGLAREFLARGCNVVVNGRTQEAVGKAVAELASLGPATSILGHPCDVTQFEQVQALWDASVAHFGTVDIWINNAGISHSQMNIWEYPPETIETVIRTNLVGALYGANVAVRGMLAQGFGSFYNIEGLGSDGRRVDGLALYGSTKCGLRYITDGLAEETKGTAVVVGAILPGMVATDFLTKQYENRPEEWERAKRIFNVLADRVETVAPWMVEKMLTNTRNGARFKWMSSAKIFWRFFTARYAKRDLFD